MIRLRFVLLTALICTISTTIGPLVATVLISFLRIVTVILLPWIIISPMRLILPSVILWMRPVCVLPLRRWSLWVCHYSPDGSEWKTQSTGNATVELMVFSESPRVGISLFRNQGINTGSELGHIQDQNRCQHHRRERVPCTVHTKQKAPTGDEYHKGNADNVNDDESSRRRTGNGDETEPQAVSKEAQSQLVSHISFSRIFPEKVQVPHSYGISPG